MKDRARFLTCFLLTALAAGPFACPARGAPQDQPIMPVAEVRPGMEGYGLTTFADGPAQRFQFKVLSVVQGWWPKGEMILIEMKGPVVDQAGIVSGMSGSPVYIADRLVGAVAYGWWFAKTPVAGVQPIEQMLGVRKIGAGAEQCRAEARTRARGALRRNRAGLAKLSAVRHRSAADAARLRDAVSRAVMPPAMAAASEGIRLDGVPAGVAGLLPRGWAGGIRPLPLPLSVSGADGRAAEFLGLLQGGGLVPVQAAAAGAAPARDREIEPGSPLSIVFLSGDMDISASGTVTWVQGEELLAFGHAMFQSGESDYPIATARVDAVVPRLSSSFRIAGAGDIVGRMSQDRSTGVWGKLGEQAPMFPCNVSIRGAVAEDYSYQAAGYWSTAPMWAFYAAALSAMRWEGWGEPVTMDASVQIQIKGRPEPLTLKNSYVEMGPIWPLFDLIADPMWDIVANPFEETAIAGLDCTLELRPGMELAIIETATPDRVRAAPGEEVTIRVRLRLYRGEEVHEVMKVRVPETARPGTQARFLICSADYSRMVDRELDPGFYYEPKDLDALIERLGRFESNRDLVLRAAFTDEGLRYDGAPMPALPPSARSVLQFNDSTGIGQPLIRDVKLSRETPWVLSGVALASIAVAEPSAHRRGGQQAAPAPAPGTQFPRR